ncbi:RluA family pseudouridine synthase [Anaerosphaera multitolerans]|uniref:Pseudouridine synthase n=1 Tax=Anaerosphaera multitolerans TaxID=2487351 RepID=A0A437S4W5_9FIRM|nr:RluA family pseudouridine synthase [Anaerosphaera multitolerans]RVU54034.1 RluA family pseudouridine synthase [Anaerosphaera multitolerans]
MLNSYEYLNYVSNISGIKLRDYLNEVGLSSRFIRTSIREKNIYLNEENIFKNEIIKIGDVVSIKFSKEDLNGYPQFKTLDIIYEDDDILVVNKEANMPTHTSKGHLRGTLLNYMAGYFLEKGIERKVRFVNRLDKDTSGLVVVAKNAFAHYNISEQFKGDVVKNYIAFCKGKFEKTEGIVEEPILRVGDSIIREVNRNGKYAKTSYRVVREIGDISIVELHLFTGRTHQIRVHLKHLGHPILGDVLYGGQDQSVKRQLLHCSYMKFSHPRTGEDLEFKADLPKDMISLLYNY